MKTIKKADTTIPQFHRLLYYRSLLGENSIKSFLRFLNNVQHQTNPNFYRSYFKLKSEIIQEVFAHNDYYAFTPWKSFIIRKILKNENLLSSMMETKNISESMPLYKSFVDEMLILQDFYRYNWPGILHNTGIDSDDILTRDCLKPNPKLHELIEAFESKDPVSILFTLSNYHYKNGLGIFEGNSSFNIDNEGKISPIPCINYKSMKTLVGYEYQKEELLKNTLSFITHQVGLNVLLQGDMGTGKSTMVKALLVEFKHTPLKMIEVKKSQLPLLPKIITCIRNRPYPIIIFLDDLSFDENDSGYKIFKNIMEGALEENPKNILIYATSNRRHLVPETKAERDNAIHVKDVLEEKLSLSSRFGLVLNFMDPNQKEYLKIVQKLCTDACIILPESEIKQLAIAWELRHLNRSGRTASQFVEYLKSSIK